MTEKAVELTFLKPSETCVLIRPVFEVRIQVSRVHRYGCTTAYKEYVMDTHPWVYINVDLYTPVWACRCYYVSLYRCEILLNLCNDGCS